MSHSLAKIAFSRLKNTLAIAGRFRTFVLPKKDAFKLKTTSTFLVYQNDSGIKNSYEKNSNGRP